MSTLSEQNRVPDGALSRPVNARTKCELRAGAYLFGCVRSDGPLDVADIPGHWPRIIGVDFGYTHPFAAAELCWDRDSDCVYVTKTHRVSEQSPIYHAAECSYPLARCGREVWMYHHWPLLIWNKGGSRRFCLLWPGPSIPTSLELWRTGPGGSSLNSPPGPQLQTKAPASNAGPRFRLLGALVHGPADMRRAVIRSHHWHLWFAWHPVIIYRRSGFPRLFWLRYVDRRWTEGVTRGLGPRWIYRKARTEERG